MSEPQEKIKNTTEQKAWMYMRQQTESREDGAERIALADGTRCYTYRQLFQNCEQYASVFSALRITGANKARVGLIGTGAAETIFTFYALNMTGAEVSLISSLSVLRAEKLMQVVADEHLTDLVITDELIQENTLRKLIWEKDALGLRFILLLHVPMGGAAVPAPMAFSFEQKSMIIRNQWAPLYMDFLIQIYGNTPISYAPSASSVTAAIIHTSGTTGGSGTPIVMSDKALNTMCRLVAGSALYDERLKKDPVCALMVDLSNAYGIIIQVHMPLCFGGKVVTVPGNGLNPLFYQVIPAEKVSVLFCTGAVMEMWMKMPSSATFDFSSLQCVIMGGTSISADDKRRYLEFIRRNRGRDIPILNGYGISELGGVCTLSSADVDDESIGFLLEGMEARLYDEDNETFHAPAEGPRTGVLYLRSETMSDGFLDGQQIVQTEEIDGKSYICTNDLVRLEADGRYTYLGRANRYFLNNSGIKYRSGLVETELSRQPGIRSCGVVPVFDKPIHDNIPMLCVTADGAPADWAKTVRGALLRCFREGKNLPADNVPSLVLIAENLPRNVNGKIDLYALNRGQVTGNKYKVEVRTGPGGIEDILLHPSQEDNKDIVAEMYRSIARDMMEESVPGQVVDSLKQAGAALMPDPSPAQYLQTQYIQMRQQLRQLGATAGHYAANRLQAAIQSGFRSMQMLEWMYLATQSEAPKKKKIQK